MKSFLEELAENMAKSEKELDRLTFVFPNRRAALYFQNFLASSLQRPQWAPGMISVEDFFKKHSDLLEPDRLTLIHRLYQVYGEVLKTDESFDRFYFWGDMLLRDFDEIDRYMVNGPQLFKDLSKIKELDATFDYLSGEQKQFLQGFWVHFESKPSFSKEQFLRLWRKLPAVYTAFTKSLKKDNLGYEGMVHRQVAETVLMKPAESGEYSHIVFAGFNALTKAEEVLITTMVASGARVFWDADSYYMDNGLQEAGQFLRSYRNHGVLGASFPKEMPSNLLDSPKKIQAVGVPQRIGQAKLAGREVESILQVLPKKNLPLELSKTVLVLPDESMLLPVMHSLPVGLEDINVTMGFPLRYTPLFSLLDQIVEMQVKRRGKSFSHREVNAILGHAYLIALTGTKSRTMHESIVAKNRVFVRADELAMDEPILQMVFQPVEPAAATNYLLEIVRYLGASFEDKSTFDREYAFHFHQQLSRLHTILYGSDKTPDWRGFQKLWRQVVITQRIPFHGEPLRGLQIMGVLETRNLDFDNVILLSLNEGLLPSAIRQGSYVPHAIRKAYGLPTYEQQDAIYAYLFYRLLQRAGNISFYYNTEPDIIGNGEMSRFLQQVLMESGLKVERKVLHNAIHVHSAKKFDITKTPLVLQLLEKYVKEGGEYEHRLSPSSLNDYVECSLRFYLKHIARLTEVDEVEEDVDARAFGNILHNVACWYYDDLLKRGTKVVSEADLEEREEVVDKLIDRAFRKFYFMEPDEPVIYEGQRVVVKAVARTFLGKILEKDREYAPFEIRMLEEPFLEHIVLESGKRVRIGGKIDRADWKDGLVRVIDYKTGKDETSFESIESLFARDQKRNKAAFQTILYAFMYALKNGAGDKIKPGLLNRTSLFGKFEFGHRMGSTYPKALIEDVRPHLEEFGVRLSAVVEEMFDPNVSFGQTTFLKSCTYCSYKSFCRR